MQKLIVMIVLGYYRVLGQNRPDLGVQKEIVKPTLLFKSHVAFVS